MSLSDRVWLFLNRKPPKRVVAYLNIVLPWFYISTLAFLGVLLAAETWLGWLLVLASLVLGLVFFLWDNRTGYLDAIYQNNLKRWEERRDRLNAGK